jgi:uncharacterized protein YndB with AHSA1/START domain
MAQKKKTLTGFDVARVKLEVEIAASRQKVWRALTRELPKWWPKSFCTKRERAKGFQMEFRLGGRMFEDWGNGDGCLWWTINKIDTENFLFSAWGYEGGAAMTVGQFQVLERGKESTLQISDATFGAADYIEGVHTSHLAGWKELFEEAFKPYMERRNRR